MGEKLMASSESHKERVDKETYVEFPPSVFSTMSRIPRRKSFPSALILADLPALQREG